MKYHRRYAPKQDFLKICREIESQGYGIIKIILPEKLHNCYEIIYSAKSIKESKYDTKR